MGKWMCSVAAATLLSACMGGGDGGADAVYVVSPDRSFADNLNGVRSNVGAGALTFDERLQRAAQSHADDMLEHDYFSHTGRDGSGVGDRVTAQGYKWRLVGENIAKGQQSETEALISWQNSDGHRRNNENPNFEDFALAKAGSGSDTYWVLVLASEF